MKILVLLLLSLLKIANSHKGGYYWRDYDGTIPEDAIVAAPNITNIPTVNLYIVQVALNDDGLIPAQLRPDIKEIPNPLYRTEKGPKFMKILCGSQRRFSWVSVTKETYHSVVKDKTPFIAGHEYFKESPTKNLSVGRHWSGGYHIARVYPETGRLYSPYYRDSFYKFDVLIYDKKKCKH